MTKSRMHSSTGTQCRLYMESEALIKSENEAAAVRIVFYCKDCRKIVEGVKIGRKYVYKCPLCHTKNVAFGTEKSIRGFYRVV